MDLIPLPVISSSQEAHKAAFVTTSVPVSYSDGFYEEEHDGPDVFRWMSNRGCLTFDPRPMECFLELWVCSEFADLSQRLTFYAGGTLETVELLHGWAPVSIEVPRGVDRLVIEPNKLFPKAYYAADPRSLAVRTRKPLLHADPRRHMSIRRQWENAVLNTREMIAGKTILASTPPQLGLDLHGACNVKPPCVYCEWDSAKEQEGDNVDAPFTPETLTEYGDFFSNAARLQNCSIGEPFMMRTLDELLDVFGDEGKTLELSTNGQILTDRNVQKLIGRDIHLYISLDAATAETYARLRNDTFHKILLNIRRLMIAKGEHQDQPKVFLVFMPILANVQELDDFVRLCAELRVDGMVLRPLNRTVGDNLRWDRAGYRFEYDKELLPFDELVRVSGRAAELCRRLGVSLLDQLDFGGELKPMFEDAYSQGREEVSTTSSMSATSGGLPHGPSVTESPTEGAGEVARVEEKPPLGVESLPVCVEPWKSIFILRRGVLPCSYGGFPIADKDGYRQAWNSTLLQGIRDKLRRGTFHEYCLRSRACPIVRKWESARQLPGGQKTFLLVWNFWRRLNSVTGGIPRRLLGRLRLLRPPAAR